MKPLVILLVAFLGGILPTGIGWAESLPSAKPEQVGLSSERLERVTQAFRNEVERGTIPGAVLLVARKGKLAYHESVGFRDKTSAAPMPKDAIFRIYSMTKPFTSVAAMVLMEEGKIVLTEPASKYVPQLAKLQVSTSQFDPSTGKARHSTVAAEREMTIQDLLRHTSGLVYEPRTLNPRVKELYKKHDVGWADVTPTDQLDRIAQVPLAHQPGTTWEYGLSTDVLGRVVEKVSGATMLGRFLDERLFGPLKMADTSFVVPKEKLGRLAQPLEVEPSTGQPIKLHDVTVAPKNDAGGAGSASTAGDYARFLQMLLNGGQLDGGRLLSPTTVALMTADHLGNIRVADPILGVGSAYGFGLGFAVRKETGLYGISGSPGEYTWGGAAGTAFWVDPKEQMIAVMMTQGAPGPARGPLRMLFRQLVQQAIVE